MSQLLRYWAQAQLSKNPAVLNTNVFISKPKYEPDTFLRLCLSLRNLCLYGLRLRTTEYLDNWACVL